MYEAQKMMVSRQLYLGKHLFSAHWEGFIDGYRIDAQHISSIADVNEASLEALSVFSQWRTETNNIQAKLCI